MVSAVQDHWKRFEQGAEAGVFEQAALVLTAMVTGPAQLQLRRAIELECRASDDELLLARKVARLAPRVCIKG